MAKAQIVIKKFLWKNDFLFPAAMWILSRIIIWTAMLLITPKLLSPVDIQSHLGWGIFDAWDSEHYRAIATHGYEFINDGKQHNLAFFPLFPLSLWALMNLGLPFEMAGALVNNLAFLAALYFLYLWVKEHFGMGTAQWVTAAMSCCPLSMFTGVIYTEGLYLFLSTAALRAFDQKQYSWTALWGAMATATRPTGMALIPALAIAAWKERRPPIAYIASLATALGIILFSVYCTIYFHDPLAFIAAQKGWRPSLGFDWEGWLNMLMQIPFGDNWNYGWVDSPNGGIKNLWHPVLFSIIVGNAFALWCYRQHLNFVKVAYGFYVLILCVLTLANEQLINNLLNLFMVLGGGCILWHFRRRLTTVSVIYGFCGIGLLIFSGGTISLSRLAYGIVPLTMAIGVLLYRHPRLGYLTLGLFVTLLVKLAVGFSQGLWVG
ncbi:hypothetical protein NIES4074_14980 [Cylindrospermum sp. NIES-4074]|nr:hypothetical protein NIES4074_14980 [Cylindrospermum sp. NIES-4074]